MSSFLLAKLRQSVRNIRGARGLGSIDDTNHNHHKNNKDDDDDLPFRSAEDALGSLFNDSQLSDVRLQGYDDGTIVAVKAVLAARSPVFHACFFGGTTTTTTTPRQQQPPRGGRKKGLPKRKELVKFDEWDYRTLQLVVEFCYTDKLSVMEFRADDDTARLMANVRAASKAFKLPRLTDKVNQWGWRQISRYPSLACAVIDEGRKRDDIDNIALESLQLKTKAALLPERHTVGTGVLALSKPGLLFVLDELQHTASHYILFQSIQRWVDASPDARFAFARKYAISYINLSTIRPKHLPLVQNSSLFKPEEELVRIEGDEMMLNAGLQFAQ